MRRDVVAVARGKEPGRLTRKCRGERLHHGHHAEARQAAAQIRRADGAVLDPMAKPVGFRRLNRVAHRLDRSVADRVRGDLQAGARGPRHELPQLVRRRAPHRRSAADRHPLRAAVDEHLDRTGPHDRASKAGAHAETRGGLEQLPRQELVDAHLQPSVLREALVAQQVVRESPIDCGADRGHASREEQALRQQDRVGATPAVRRRLHVGDQAHRRLEQEAVGRAALVAPELAAVRVGRRGCDPGRGERGRVRDAQVTSALVDVSGARARREVQLCAVRRALLGELEGAEAHALLPLAGPQSRSMLPQPRHDVRDILGSAEVGSEAREAEVHDVRMRVVETRKHGGAAEAHDTSPRAAQTHHLRATRGQHATRGDRQVSARAEPGTAEGTDSPAGEDQLSAQSPIE